MEDIILSWCYESYITFIVGRNDTNSGVFFHLCPFLRFQVILLIYKFNLVFRIRARAHNTCLWAAVISKYDHGAIWPYRIHYVTCVSVCVCACLHANSGCLRLRKNMFFSAKLCMQWPQGKTSLCCSLKIKMYIRREEDRERKGVVIFYFEL